MQLFLYSKWLSLPINTRIKIAKQFNIQKRGSTEVVDNQIKSDGYNIKEIEEALNIDAIQTYLEVNETDMMTLWMWLIDKIEGRELTQVNIDTTLEKQISKTVEGYKNLIDKSSSSQAEKDTIVKKYENEVRGAVIEVKPKRGRPKAK